MADRDAISKDLDRQILETHERFAQVIARRLPAMSLEQKERYFALLSLVVNKLDDAGKPMKQVLQELVGEALPIVMSEL